ncbi:hypothetical protein GCM10010371_02220 [Streptomyces subrutilus]|uniref:Uncharacterized protein n=1 Tax=Streptomyces subrutilus TaxID=36818 RepID=A0A918UZA4_9ACTN|nr:hypothetical protein GCM10010371_02220 [Streptomyces subrutilus]
MTRPAPTGAREPHRRTPGARPLPGCGQDGGVTVRAVPAVRRVRWNHVMKAVAQATDTSGGRAVARPPSTESRRSRGRWG